MGDKYLIKTKHHRGRLGKVDSLLNKKLENVEWGEFELGDLFEQLRGKESAPNRVPDGSHNMINEISTNNGVTKKAYSKNILKGNSITVSVNYAQNVFYQKDDFCASVNILVLKSNWLSKNKGLFTTTIISRNNNLKYDYSSKISKDRLNNDKILLPTKNGKIDFDFMENFIADIETERIEKLENYLNATCLKNYTLTEEEVQVLKDFEDDSINFGTFTYNRIFNNINQGRRLKKEDQISGNIPFVMAGTTNTGVVNNISNPVARFPKNSITIDIFGNTFYRNYDYGAGDDTGVYWSNDKEYSKELMLFFTTSMEKSILGKFDYGNKLRSSQSLNFKMQLPTTNNQPNYKLMETFISAVQKLVIKDVVLYVDNKMSKTI